MVEETVVTRKRSRQHLLEIPEEIANYNAINIVNETVEAIDKNDTVENIDTSAKEEDKENFVMSNVETQEQSTTQAIANVERKFYGENTTENSKKVVDISDLLMAQRNVLYASFLDSVKKDQALQKLKMLLVL